MTTYTMQDTVIAEAKTEHVTLDIYGYGDREVTVKEVEDKLKDQRDTISKLNKMITDIRTEVRDSLHQFDKKTDKVELDLEDVNEILENIGATKISFNYKATVTYTVTIVGIEAESEEEAERKALSAVDVRPDLSGLGDDADVYNEEYEAEDVEMENE